MTDNEINMFIDAMSDLGDVWDFADAKRVYGEFTLEDAINERQSLAGKHLNNIAAILK